MQQTFTDAYAPPSSGMLPRPITWVPQRRQKKKRVLLAPPRVLGEAVLAGGEAERVRLDDRAGRAALHAQRAVAAPDGRGEIELDLEADGAAMAAAVMRGWCGHEAS